jgi:uncharacterized protein YegL
MNELMVIVFGLAVIRTITPLTEQENWNIPKLSVAISTSWAFYHLLTNCANITMSFNIL